MEPYTPSVDFTKWSCLLHERLFELKDLNGITRKSLHDWIAVGIVGDNRPLSRSGHRNYFSPLTLIWIALVSDLKDFGVSSKKIKGCKTALFAPITAQDGNSYPALEYYMIHTLAYRIPIFIVLTQEGELLILDEKDYFKEIREAAISNHLCLALHKEIEDNLSSLYSPPEFELMAGLSSQELQILEIVRSQKYSSIRIAKKNGKVDVIEGVENLSHTTDIAKVLQSGRYQNLEIKQHNGKIARIERTTRKLL